MSICALTARCRLEVSLCWHAFPCSTPLAWWSFPPTVLPLQIGGLLALVHLALSNGAYTFTSPPCTIVTPSFEVECVAPPGVGAGHAVTIVVDGVPSAPLANRTLAYAPPSLTSIAVLSGDGEADGGVPTLGGSTVVITGLVRSGDAFRLPMLMAPLSLLPSRFDSHDALGSC